MSYQKDFCDFINQSVVSFYAISNAEAKLIEAGYVRVFENDLSNVKAGNKIYFKRMDLSLIAFDLGKEIEQYQYPLHIIASHVDSPCFKVKPNIQNNAVYRLINVEPYGGMIVPSWLDRLLCIAGRVTYKKDDKITSTLVNMNQDM